MSDVQNLAEEGTVPRLARYSAANIGAGCALGALGLVVAVESLRIGVLADRNLGPGAWPLASAIVLVACSVVIALSKPGTDETNGAQEFIPYGRLISALAIMCSFTVLFQLVGVASATFVATTVWLKFIARETWRLSVIASLLLAAGIYLVFVILLDIPLPVDAFLPTQW